MDPHYLDFQYSRDVVAPLSPLLADFFTTAFPSSFLVSLAPIIKESAPAREKAIIVLRFVKNAIPSAELPIPPFGGRCPQFE